MNIEVKQTENQRWGLFVNSILIGDSKQRFDADHAKVMLEKALDLREAKIQEVDNPKVRSCNRHANCDDADIIARSKGHFGADHCHDECCEDCFGS